MVALAIGAVHYRFVWHMKQGHEFPTAEALATFCLTIGGIVSMPFAFLAMHFMVGAVTVHVLIVHQTMMS